MVNVLQSVILTEGEKMIKTPTYHIMHMYKYHQDADLLASYIDGNKEVGEEDSKVMQLSESVSVSSDGTINATVGNLSVSDDAELTMILTQKEIKSVEASIVTGAMADHNTFDDPEKVTEKAFKDYKTDGRKLSLTIPKNSVVLLRVK
jgi:alpha-N-arabinofuranosidase